MNDQQAIETAKKLIEWARERWGVEKEVVYDCPVDGYYRSYTEGYCPDDGRKLQRKVIESQTQTYRHNLEDFMYEPADWTMAAPTAELGEVGE